MSDVSNMRRLLFHCLPLLIAATCLTPSRGHGAAVDWERLTTAPTDTAEARRLRIWLPLEKSSHCRTSIDIFDQSGWAICRLIDQLMGPGYYNFYWDKRDDSGHFVEPGTYRWRAINCSDTIIGELTAQYHEWERSSRIEVIDSVGQARFLLILDNDSALVSAVIWNHRGRHISDLVQDTLLSKGRHLLHWDPPSGYAGRFVISVTVGGFDHRQGFLMRRTPR
ncbi:MAG: hypothetical protein ABIE70_11340 [bacterium]